jgi:hypothetical protein
MEEQKAQDDARDDDETLKDLDVDQSEADKVTGGRARAADPCEGGE